MIHAGTRRMHHGSHVVLRRDGGPGGVAGLPERASASGKEISGDPGSASRLRGCPSRRSRERTSSGTGGQPDQEAGGGGTKGPPDRLGPFHAGPSLGGCPTRD